MHCPDDVLEARVLSGWVNPPGGLELMDLTHPLDPGMVDDLAFGRFSIWEIDMRDERDIAMHGIVRETFLQAVFHAASVSERSEFSRAAVLGGFGLAMWHERPGGLFLARVSEFPICPRLRSLKFDRMRETSPLRQPRALFYA